MTVTTTILDAITVSGSEGRPIPDAATREVIGYAPIHTVADLDRALDDAPGPRSRLGRLSVTSSARAS